MGEVEFVKNLAKIAREGTTWRYALTREVFDGEDFYTIREVYTGPNGELSWTDSAIAPRGDTWIEAVNDIALMTRAMTEPILDISMDPPMWVPVLVNKRRERIAKQIREEAKAMAEEDADG